MDAVTADCELALPALLVLCGLDKLEGNLAALGAAVQLPRLVVAVHDPMPRIAHHDRCGNVVEQFCLESPRVGHGVDLLERRARPDLRRRAPIPQTRDTRARAVRDARTSCPLRGWSSATVLPPFVFHVCRISCVVVVQ